MRSIPCTGAQQFWHQCAVSGITISSSLMSVAAATPKCCRAVLVLLLVVALVAFAYLPGVDLLRVLAHQRGLERQVASGRGRSGHIPHIVHLTWKTQDVPEKFVPFVRSWKEHNPGIEVRLWSDGDLRRLIAENHTWFLPTFDSYPRQINRVDAARFFILHDFGGLYSDIDIGCKEHVPEHLWHKQAVVFAAHSFGLTLGNIMAERSHPLISDVIANLPRTARRQYAVSPYISVMFSTGPLAFTRVYEEFPAHDEVHVVGWAEWDRKFSFTDGESWHGWDGRFFKWTETNRRALMLILKDDPDGLRERLRRAEELNVQLVTTIEEERARSARLFEHRQPAQEDQQLRARVQQLEAALAEAKAEHARARAACATSVLRTLPVSACWFESGRLSLASLRRKGAALAPRSATYVFTTKLTNRVPSKGVARHVSCWLVSPGSGSVRKLPSSVVSVREDTVSVALNTGMAEWADPVAAVEWVAWAHPASSQAASVIVEHVYVSPPTPPNTRNLISEIELFLKSNGINEGDARGQTLMHAAAVSGNTELLNWLVQQGAAVDAEDFQRRTPLLCALSSGKFAAARLLLLSGADPLARCDAGATALHHLFKCQRYAPEFPEMLAAVVNAGVMIDTENAAGETALHVAAERSLGAEQIVLLLRHGADPNHRCAQSRETPLHYAVQRNQKPEVVSALLAADAKHVDSANVIRALALAKEGNSQQLVELLSGRGQSRGIPERIVARVLVKLPPKDLVSTRMVCKLFAKVADELMSHSVYWALHRTTREQFRQQHSKTNIEYGYMTLKRNFEANMAEWVTRPFTIRAEEATEYDALLKFVCLGDSATGKTAFVTRLSSNIFLEEHSETMAIEMKQILRTSGGKLAKIQLWDQASPRFKQRATPQYYRGAHGYLIFYDITSRQSWQNIPYWLQEAGTYANSACFSAVIVGTKADLEDDRQVALDEAMAFSNLREIPVFETSSMLCANVETAVKALTEMALRKQQGLPDMPYPVSPTSSPSSRSPTSQLLRVQAAIPTAPLPPSPSSSSSPPQGKPRPAPVVPAQGSPAGPGTLSPRTMAGMQRSNGSPTSVQRAQQHGRGLQSMAVSTVGSGVAAHGCTALADPRKECRVM
eukprot:m51a1_g6026 hypothetical protein (1118) ;mRNA; r:102156-107072